MTAETLTPEPASTRPPGGSYAPHATTPGGLPAELARLAAQARLTWEQEWQVLASLGLAPGSRLLDLGCGTGAFGALLAERLPDTPVVGVDVDPELLGHAARSGRLVLGRGTDLPFRAASFGGVVARYVLQHVATPLAVLREAARVLEPGGWVACVDVDEQLWGVAEPAAAGLEDVYRRAAGTQADRGGDRAVVRRLPVLMRRAGLVDITVRPFAVTSQERLLADLALHVSPERLLPALSEGRITLGDYLRVSMAHQRLLADPDAFVMLLGFVVVGRVPAAHPTSPRPANPRSASPRPASPRPSHPARRT